MIKELLASIEREHPELVSRCRIANTNTLREDYEQVVVWLRRAFRVDSNPAIELGLLLAERFEKPLLVYSEIYEAEPYLSFRHAAFAYRANELLYKSLAAHGINHRFSLVSKDTKGHGPLGYAAERACVLITDDVVSPFEIKRLEIFAQQTSAAVLAVDTTRLVPHALLKGRLLQTKAFRAATSHLRDDCLAARNETASKLSLSTINTLPAECEDAFPAWEDCEKAFATWDIQSTVKPSKEHPASKDELDTRLSILETDFAKRYRATRNNPALLRSTSELSPHIRYGMTSPWEILNKIEQSGVSRSDSWKFRDELLTWREWSHYQLAQDPMLTRYESLPKSARKTLDEHRHDKRELILPKEDLFYGRTPDLTWNAAQHVWRETGWLHNNLRMYWAKQFLRWTETPEQAWEYACEFNNCQSLDGLEPATYLSIRWAFGDARPAYSEAPVYGWVSRKSDSALLKRAGFIKWRASVLERYGSSNTN